MRATRQQVTAVAALEDSRSHDLTFWHGRHQGNAAGFYPGVSLLGRKRRRETGLEKS